jgi:sugar lactone lactonase YvrE
MKTNKRMQTRIGAALVALVALVALGAAPAARAQSIVGPVQVVARFDGSKLETPESVAIDYLGNRYVSLALTGEIRKIAPDGSQSTLALLPMGASPLTPCLGFIPIMGALAIDHRGNLYVGVNSCDLSARGVYRIDPDGTTHLVANLPAQALADGIALRDKQLYIADTGQMVVLRLSVDGGPVEIWKDDPLLKKDPSAPPIYPGPNGIQFFEGEVYVSVSGGFRIVAIPVLHDGSAGAVRVHASGIGCDDFAFDVLGNLYCTTDPFETMVLVRPDGSLQPLLGAADGLDGPTATLFGRRADGSHDLYITNGMFPFFPSTGNGPSLLRVKLDVPGLPRP